jgi:Subtilase family
MSCCAPAGLVYLRRLLASRHDIAVFPADALDREEPPETVYFYRPAEILLPEDEVAYFREIAARLKLRYVPLDDWPEPDFRPVRSDRYNPRAASVARFLVSGGGDLEAILVALERASRGRLHPTPNHVWFGCPRWQFEPHGDPSPYPLASLEQLAVMMSEDDGAPAEEGRLLVAVIDSGLPKQYAENPFLQVVSVDSPPSSQEEPWDYQDPSVVMTSPDGHGSFVSGVVRITWPGADIRSYMALDTDGVVDQTDLISQIDLALGDQAQVVNLSLGGNTRNNQAPLGFAAIRARAETAGGPIFVAAAGNLSSDRLFWPAAFSWVIAVGATEMVGEPLRPVQASFTDFGEWVDVWANGVDVVSAYEANAYRSVDPDVPLMQFAGAARWSGTSFAAPQVAAVIAAHRRANPGLGFAGALAYLAGRPDAQVPGLGTFVW